jgi:hypothetical protein
VIGVLDIVLQRRTGMAGVIADVGELRVAMGRSILWGIIREAVSGECTWGRE